jgi:hypothetical protein
MKRKVALADVLWDAANKHLEDPTGGTSMWSGSCCAVGNALGIWPAYERNQSLHDVAQASPTFVFLAELGCHTRLLLWDDNYTDHPQGVRYMWLLLAMHVAEDEGIEIEVESA